MSYRNEQSSTRRYAPLRKSRAKTSPDPAGRVDLLVKRLLIRGLEIFEERKGLKGLTKELTPMVEGIVGEFIPARPLFKRRRLC